MPDLDNDARATRRSGRRGPVRVTLAAPSLTDVTFMFDVWREVTDVSDVGPIVYQRDVNEFAMTFTAVRQTPLRGGSR